MKASQRGNLFSFGGCESRRIACRLADAEGPQKVDGSLLGCHLLSQVDESVFFITAVSQFGRGSAETESASCAGCKDGSIVIVLRSADHAGAAPRKDAIRVESYIAGYILRQATSTRSHPCQSLSLLPVHLTCLGHKA
eukprot:5945385-Amphidinium_carterae.2